MSSSTKEVDANGNATVTTMVTDSIATSSAADYVPCNFEYEKAVFFRKLDPNTKEETIRAALSAFGPLDYCYIVKNEE